MTTNTLLRSLIKIGKGFAIPRHALSPLRHIYTTHASCFATPTSSIIVFNLLKSSANRKVIPSRIMSNFVGRMNQQTGQLEWVKQEDDHDYYLEISRSLYGDMLHDKERNVQYDQAIQKAVQAYLDVNPSSSSCNVLDIGTGTGLLALMAARAGAKKIYACEAFQPMAQLAQKIITENRYQDNIKIIQKRSTSMTADDDMDGCKADLIVMEIFDSELIGEGVLGTMLHAQQNLVKPNCVSVPAAAKIYVQACESKFLQKCCNLNPVKRTESCDWEFAVPQSFTDNNFYPSSAFCMHVDQLYPKDIKLLTSPIEALTFDFCSPIKSQMSVRRVEGKDNEFTISGRRTLELTAIEDGVCHGLLFWWVLKMDCEGNIELSTAPKWIDNKSNHNLQWRDHWMQAVYFCPQSISVTKVVIMYLGKSISIDVSHDEYNIWFNVSSSPRTNATSDVDKYSHQLCWDKMRLSGLNNVEKQRKYYNVIRKHIQNSFNVHCVSVGDGSLLPLMAASAGARKVIAIESSKKSRDTIRELVRANGLNKKIMISPRNLADIGSDDLLGNKIDILLGEPYFGGSVFSWYTYWYARTSLENFMADKVAVIPAFAIIRAIAVELDHNWLLRSPISDVEGFSMGGYNDLLDIVKSRLPNTDCNHEIEAIPLWEYPCRALTDKFDLLRFDFSKPLPMNTVVNSGKLQFKRSGICHAIVIWLDYFLDEEEVVSTGLNQVSDDDHGTIEWCKDYKQGIIILSQPENIQNSADDRDIYFNAIFNPDEANVHFKFKLKHAEIITNWEN
ncbi:Protein arginine N-methyltransferase 7 [Trichoplax sp. H2]|nr:Protein arginine N-methyltransferase 7 [Trichoplax sp. H2]|eukprot:RDD44130.1 Protein arginine N-methyltransferase 7 [Trichoplax sp. H2]